MLLFFCDTMSESYDKFYKGLWKWEGIKKSQNNSTLLVGKNIM